MLVAKFSSLSSMHHHSGVLACTPDRIVTTELRCGDGASRLGFFSRLPISCHHLQGLSINGNRCPRLSFSLCADSSTLLPIVSSLWRLYSSSGKDELDTAESLATDNVGITMVENSSVATEGEVIQVKFVLEKHCHFGQTFNVVGNDPLFGDWDPKASVPMTWSEGHIWSVELDVPVGKVFEYKLILTGKRGEIEWQPGPNRSFDTSGSIPLLLSETWDIDGGTTESAKDETVDKDTAEATEDETVTEEEDTAKTETIMEDDTDEAAKTETLMEDDTAESAEDQTVPEEEDANEVEDKMMTDEASFPSAVKKCVEEIAETMGAIPELESSRDGTSISG